MTPTASSHWVVMRDPGNSGWLSQIVGVVGGLFGTGRSGGVAGVDRGVWDDDKGRTVPLL